MTRRGGQCYVPGSSSGGGLSFGVFLGSLEHPGFVNTSTVCIDDGCLLAGGCSNISMHRC